MNVLIDDDKLIRMSWELAAKKAGVELYTFDSFASLMVVIQNFPKETRFYIDSQVGDEVPGEIAAKKIYDLGFTELFMASGLDLKREDLPSYIKGIVSKRALF